MVLPFAALAFENPVTAAVVALRGVVARRFPAAS
jgi:hypothetical protein